MTADDDYPTPLSDVVRRLVAEDSDPNNRIHFAWLTGEPKKPGLEGDHVTMAALARCAAPPFTTGYTDARKALGLGEPPRAVVKDALKQRLFVLIQDGYQQAAEHFKMGLPRVDPAPTFRGIVNIVIDTVLGGPGPLESDVSALAGLSSDRLRELGGFPDDETL